MSDDIRIQPGDIRFIIVKQGSRTRSLSLFDEHWGVVHRVRSDHSIIVLSVIDKYIDYDGHVQQVAICLADGMVGMCMNRWFLRLTADKGHEVDC